MKSYGKLLRLAMILALTLITVGAIGFQTAGVRAQDELTCAGEPFLGAPSGDATGDAAATPEEGADAAEDEAATPEEAADAAADDAAAGGDGELNIVFLPKDVVNPYFGTAALGAQEAADELGGQFQQVGPQESNAAE